MEKSLAVKGALAREQKTTCTTSKLHGGKTGMMMWPEPNLRKGQKKSETSGKKRTHPMSLSPGLGSSRPPLQGMN